MKKTYVVQMTIDVVVIILGIYMYLFKEINRMDSNIVFFITMSIYAILELCEYIFDRERYEPLYIFFASAAAAFASMFLREYTANYVLTGTISVWTLTFIIIKMNELESICDDRKHLFLIRLTSMSIFALIGILVSINLYFRISSIGYMLAFLFTCYGTFELISDLCTYFSEDISFFKE